MDKLTIEHLLPYLPHKLMVVLSDEGRFNLDDEYPNEHKYKHGKVTQFSIGEDFSVYGEFKVSERTYFSFNELTEIKPLLLPLSYLTKEITHEGRSFVPIVELAKIAEKDHFSETNLKLKSLELTHGVAWSSSEGRTFGFVYSMEHNGFYLKAIPYLEVVIADQPKLFAKLHEWHFDIHSLIERNLAIDKATLQNKN